MGFFSDLKEDLSQAVNELMPEEDLNQGDVAETKEQPVKNMPETTEKVQTEQPTDATKDNAALEEMLKNLDSIEILQANAEEKPVEEAEETPEQSAEEAALDLDHVLQNDMTVGSVLEQEHREENKGAEKRMDVKTASDENAIITAGMVITGDVSSEGSMDLVGTINGNIDILGKLNITGYINGNSKAAEIFAEGAKINGEIMSEGSVKIGASTVVIGNITATSAAIAGAVKGDIDVQGPVILDSSAIVMGNIKSKSVQINNGAVIEGMCSQCYAEVSPTSFFDDYKPEKKKKRGGHGLTIVMLLMGVVILIAIILVAGKASGLIGSNNDTDKKTEASDTSESDDDGMVTVPNLVGKTEDEAKNITKDMKLGIQPMGEEASNQAKGTISSQDIPKGSKVEQYTTIKYYISKGAQQITIPDVDGQTGVDAQQTLEDMGLTVEIQKEYSELNDDGTPVTDPGYAVSTTPTAGNSVSAGDSVTLLVSRGVDYGDSVEVPSVVGMTKNDAVTTFGKFLNVEVKEEKSTEVAEGEVISQEPEAGNWEDPDNVNVVITVSTGDQEPSAQSDSADTAASSDAPAQTADNSAAATAGEVWKCTQTLNTPSGYSGGPVRLELIQNVNGTPTASVVLEDQVIQFPYDLDITGAPGISEGTLYLSEQISGTYQELGNYSITFAKAE